MKSYFQLDDNIIHLNHAAVAPWPLQTRDAVIAFANENASIGSQNYDDWLLVEQQLKHKLASLINARSTDEIAILKNTSEGLSLVAQGLDFRAGHNIVIPAGEFPSNRVVWQALEARGVSLRQVSLQDSDDPEQVLIDAMDSDTRLLSCSSVQYASGLRLDLKRLGQACKQHDALFCVDAIQSLGAMVFDVQDCGADFVVADGHKWMCGPEGTALFYCRSEVLPLLQLQQYGWHMLKQPFDFSRQSNEIEVADDARRFESGSPNMMGIMALNASLEMLLEVGMKQIQAMVQGNTAYMIDRLQPQKDIQILSPVVEQHYAAIISFVKQGVDNVKLYQQLQDNNIICAFRGGGIRFSPHFYTRREKIDIALDMVIDFA